MTLVRTSIADERALGATAAAAEGYSLILSLGRVESLHALIVSVCPSQPEGFHLIFFHTKIRGTSFFVTCVTEHPAVKKSQYTISVTKSMDVQGRGRTHRVETQRESSTSACSYVRLVGL